MSDLIAQTLADPAVSAIGLAVAIAAVALWLAGAWWAYADATRRTEHSLAGFVAAGWVLLSTPLMLPLSLAVYAFARPPVAASDLRVRNLVEELGANANDQRCAICGAEADLSWLRCPACASWLASPCSACGRWSEASLEACPWCGDESRERPFVPNLASPPVPIAVAADLAPERLDRPLRLPRRAASPTVSRAHRSENRRLALPSDRRRLGRARTHA